MDVTTLERLRPHEIALLRGGTRATVTVAVVSLYLRGAVEAGKPGTLRASEAAVEVADPLERAVLGCLGKPLTPEELAGRRPVRAAAARLPAGPDGSASPGAGRPARRTRPARSARHALRELRARRPLPASRFGLSDADKLLAVALHGEAALAVVVPVFALRSGLVHRVRITHRAMARHRDRNDDRWDDTLLWGAFAPGVDAGGGDGGGW